MIEEDKKLKSLFGEETEDLKSKWLSDAVESERSEKNK